MTDRRIRSETVTINLHPHPVDVSLAWDDKGLLHEVVFVGGYKVGSGVHHLLHDLGVALSRAIQGRNPDTGEAS
jgi:hypothetical protein